MEIGTLTVLDARWVSISNRHFVFHKFTLNNDVCNSSIFRIVSVLWKTKASSKSMESPTVSNITMLVNVQIVFESAGFKISTLAYLKQLLWECLDGLPKCP
jgi:hypothetical protein